ncbi:MAG: heparinase II/III family protein [Planctomycetota bacterium]|nr:heparinase II/III family protein [Planctomycetota bacterium]
MANPFAFGSAAALYREHAHPRLLCDSAGLEHLRKQVRTGYGLTIMEALRLKVRPIVAEMLAAKDPVPLVRLRRGAEVGTGLALPFVADVAMVAVLDDDADAREAARRILAAVPVVSRGEKHDRISLGFSHYGTIGIAYDLLHAHLPETERSAIAAWLAEFSVRESLDVLTNLRYLRHAGMNIPMDGMITAVMSLLAVEGDPGVPDLAKEKATLLQYLESTLNAAFGPEGYPNEDIGYGTEMPCLMAPAVEAVRRAGLLDAYAACPRWAKFGRAVLHFAQPWGDRLSNTGDYGADFGVTSTILPRLAQETHDPTLLWLHGLTTYPIACSGPWADRSHLQVVYPELTLAKDFRVPVDLFSLLTLDALAPAPVHPSAASPRLPTQFMDPERGIVSFRSSWKPDATFVVFDGAHRSAAAQGHAHDSGGHFSLSALGEYFAIDTGRYSIEQEHHNVVIVDGKSGHVGDGSWKASRYQATLAGYWPGDFVDTAHVVYSQMADCYWAKRTLGLVKGDEAPGYVFTVEDVNKADDFREFWWLLNVHPDSAIELRDASATVVGATHGHLLDVHFALPAEREYPKPHTLALQQNVQLAGSPKEYGGDPHASAEQYRKRIGNLAYGPVFERPRLVAKVAGYNGRFMSLLLPRLKSEAPARVERLPSLDGSLAVRITFAKVEDTLVWAYEHRLLEAGDVVARGNWCVVRRDRASGKVIRHAMHDGTRLVVGKQTVSL